MGWLYVFLASINEVIGIWGLNNFNKKHTIKNSMQYIGGLGGSFAFIYISFGYLPATVAYTVWTGVSTASVVLMNMIFFGESKNFLRIVSLCSIIIGVTGLELLS